MLALAGLLAGCICACFILATALFLRAAKQGDSSRLFGKYAVVVTDDATFTDAATADIALFSAYNGHRELLEGQVILYDDNGTEYYGTLKSQDGSELTVRTPQNKTVAVSASSVKACYTDAGGLLQSFYGFVAGTVGIWVLAAAVAAFAAAFIVLFYLTKKK